MSESSDRELRRWLQVPDGRPLPSWAERRLGASHARDMRARTGTPLEQVVFGIVDLETSGTSSDADRILEIGLVVQQQGRVRQRFATLADQSAAVPASYPVLSGRSVAELEAEPGEEQAMALFAAVLADHGVQVLVAHNAAFDRRFLERAWERHALEVSLPPILCSLKLARAWVSARTYSLDALVSQLGISEQVRHRALGDAEMTAALWLELLARGRQRGVFTLEALRDHCEPGRAPARKQSRGRRVPPVDGSSTIR